RYYCFYSGGRWENESYGVDYGEAKQALGPYDHPSSAQGPRVLRSVPGRLLGPGHNSIVVGPDGHTEYLIYHTWDAEGRGRQMCLDRLIWTKEGPRSHG